ncbi:hypothetical protein K7X08_022346 [Anisodus acutangulus]|uniref:Uncharacterized protein n=1 Tax=Anisodus acutangulus TaxID=402998 RepID=A0A9Q1MHT3_9SOLA|nr:hypothetical protein K7X08_022346 [Anisodus acutangulus]
MEAEENSAKLCVKVYWPNRRRTSKICILTVQSSFYLPTNILLIAFFNYYYTFLQLDPDDVSDQLKRQGASIPLVRPVRFFLHWSLSVHLAKDMLLGIFKNTDWCVSDSPKAIHFRRIRQECSSMFGGLEQHRTKVLSRISVLGSAFLAVLAAGPAVIEQATHLTSFRGFAGTSVLILVGCATDTARKVQAEIISQKYKNIEFYDIDNKY